MIICICKSLNESTIQNMIQQGQSVKQIIEITGACKTCGKCAEHLQRLYQETCSQQ